MEIERKFLMDGFPELPEATRAVMEQGYISADPVVRIRAKHSSRGSTYKLCFKSKGTLVRRETELPLTREQYEELLGYLPMPPVRKEFRTYALPGGLTLECSLVDEGAPTAFYYAEVEFPTVEAAMAFEPLPCLGREMTEEPDFTMSAYWSRKLAGWQKGEHQP